MAAPPSPAPDDDLLKLAEKQKQFSPPNEPLSEAEKELLRAAPKGEFAWCGPSRRDDDPENDPSKAGQWGPERTLRAALLRWLCVDRQARELVDPKGLQVFAAKISGDLDLSFVAVPFPLGLGRCRLVEDADLQYVEIPALNLRGSWVRRLAADGARVKGGLFLRDGFYAEGEVRLLGAEIGGTLDCVDGAFKNPAKTDVPGSGKALNADRMKVTGSVFLRDGFSAEGEVRLLGAEIGGGLDCERGTFKNPAKTDVPGSGKALNADRIKVTGSVFLGDGFRSEGEVRLLGAEIGGDLNCVRGTFKNPAQKDVGGSGKALSADGMKVTGSVVLSDGFQAEGEVRLLGAGIGGNFQCDRSTFKNPAQKDVEGSGKALNAGRITVKGSVFLHHGFHAEGEVRFLGAKVEGAFNCAGGTFHNPAQKDVKGSGDALSADGIKVKRGVFLVDGFRAEGLVRFLGAQIGGGLSCVRGTIHNPSQEDVLGSGKALGADGINVTGNVLLRDGFQAEGEVRLLSAEIGGDLDCCRGAFATITAHTAVIKGKLLWAGIVKPRDTVMNLTNARADSIMDDKASWPEKGKLVLNGFVYGRISEGPATAEERLKWLARQVPFHPQPYRQLAKVLRENGDDAGSRDVLYEMEDRIWSEIKVGYAKLIRFPLKVIVGYGRRPFWAFGWLAGLVCFGWLLYGTGYVTGAMTPRDKEAYAHFEKHNRPPEHLADFSPLFYSVENSFPLVKLWQADAWQPEPETSTPAVTGGNLIARARQFFTWRRILLWFLWVQILLGWALATLFVGGVTGLIRHD